MIFPLLWFLWLQCEELFFQAINPLFESDVLFF
ncbi:hypothetical protein L931_07580 [Helicobacter pylori PZ5024]|uniref:Uncharacterized protein n=1 Tax=Helicobacter pylori PZ5024 TaxID=1337391 RepID=T2T3G9_HELPX|nr:hypothetical protein L930_05200 [Helicobacter pylori PZ5004]EQD99432.1 hypothetical protein L931_07580 [Helicobacter pylori PZ5024]